MEQVLRAFAECSGEKLDVHLTRPEDVGKVAWPACNGDAECIWEPRLDAFVLRVGNNDLSDAVDKGDDLAFELVKNLGLRVEEAETSPALDETYGRDCTCGIVWFEGYSERMVSPPRPKNPDN